MAKHSANDPWALFRYKAFISYAHSDTEFAEWLETRLGAFDVPRELHGQWTPIGPVPKNLRPVFRDQTNLSASHDLSEELKARLAESATLIVICSPAAAASKWVAAEIEHFRSIGRGDRIFSIIVDGVPRGENGANCFPEPFLKQEPIAANAREPDDGGEGRESALIRLVAGMLRVDPIELQDKENALLAARARSARRLAMIFAGVAAVAILSAGFAISETIRANRSLAVAQETIDGVIETLESDDMQQVWGFQSIEADLLGRLTELQSQLGQGGRRTATVQATLLMRQAGVESMRGNIEETLALNERAYDAIVPAALRSNATSEQRALALRATYRYFRALGSLSRTDEQERILTESEPILRAALAGEPSDAERRWAALWLDNRRQLLSGRNDHGAALNSADEAVALVQLDDPSSASIERRIDYALVVGNRSYTLRSLNRDEEARQASARYCRLVADLFAEAPMHRDVRRFEIDCQFDEATSRFDRRDRAGAINAIQRAISLAEPAAAGNRGDMSFRAALATAHYRIGEVERWLDSNPTAAVQSYQRALTIWGDVYSTPSTQVGFFDNLENAFNAYTGALDAIEQEDTSSRVRHAEDILARYNTFEDCGERLGGSSTCGRVVILASRAAATRLFAVGRGAEVVEPLRLAARLAQQVESIDWYRRRSETFETSCAIRRDVGRALVMANRQQEAVSPLREAIEDCGVFMREHDYDMYIRSAVLGAHLWLSRAERAAGQPAAARQTLAACYALYGANCYEEYAQVLEQGIGGPVDLVTARTVRAQRAYTNMKRFTIPVRARGSEVTFPFHVYIFERPPNFPYQGIDDQIRWLEVNRGLEVAPEVGQSFRRLEEIARENNVSFPDLAVYAVGAAQ
jgi:hypothetical protein